MTDEFDHDELRIGDRVEDDEPYYEEKRDAEQYLANLLKHISEDGEEFNPPSVSTEEQTITDGEDSEFVWSVDDSDLVLEGADDFIIQNPKTTVDGEKRPILHEGGTFGEVGLHDLNLHATQLVLGDNAEANADSLSLGPRAGEESAGENMTNVGELAGLRAETESGAHFGLRSGQDSSGKNMTNVGSGTGRNADGDDMTNVGYFAGNGADSGRSTFIGYLAGRDSEASNSAGIGRNALEDSTGSNLAALGMHAGDGSTGSTGSYVGRAAAEDNSGDDVIAIGLYAARDNTGHGVIGLGREAAEGNTEDDIFVVTDQNGNQRLKMDLSTGNLEIDGELTENADL